MKLALGAFNVTLIGIGAIIPISGSGYAYSYATLGELVAWKK